MVGPGAATAAGATAATVAGATVAGATAAGPTAATAGATAVGATAARKLEVAENGWLLGNQRLESFYMGRLIAFERNIGRRRHTVEELDAGIDSWEAEFAMDLEAVSEITH